MTDWTIVQLPELPDLNTRQAIIRWAEESAAGKFIPFSRMDRRGRRAFGVEFQLPEDADRFRRQWVEPSA